ncbi:DNA-binding CsgD family transcriptional regulator [Friedmanniella endophytica]|uniref:DNA-binding CsgD family transcriptional regulator n=1 Tax=Microlunatus kandeliicorticis TaxID=1759536 RepID=A0A7W3INU2_9ACTN|nr:WhiB family transcriptional regulator [Microlunatus kandeliicorticis]MBA8792505.1 DNA-binding CsgD family transcriptional regulator [Microlunatus kandeliicorticis]
MTSQRPPAPSLTPCATRSELFTHPLLEEPPTGETDPTVRRRYETLLREATALCASCPVQAKCLFAAVVDHDVAGVIAGTTEKQRRAIRRRLKLKVEPEDLDALAGVSVPHHRIDREEVLRLRMSRPHDTLDQLAERLGCSTSTVKRHLRRDRLGLDEPRQSVRPAVTPTQVLAVARQVANRQGPRARAA